MHLLQTYDLDLDQPFYPLTAGKFDGLFIDGDLTIVSIPGPGVESITLRQLLQHRSGLKTGSGFSCSALNKILGVGTVNPPGTYAYANSNYCLLREVIEQVSRMGHIDYVQTHILDAMGVGGMSCTPDAVDPTLYYNTIGDPAFLWGSYESSCSAYGWYASAEQLGAFLAGVRFHLAVTAPVTDLMLQECGSIGGGKDYCLGWQRMTTSSVGLHYWHSGDWIKKSCGGDCNKGLNGTIMRFPLGVDASLLVNTRGGENGNPGLKSEVTILRECFAEAYHLANDGT